MADDTQTGRAEIVAALREIADRAERGELAGALAVAMDRDGTIVMCGGGPTDVVAALMAAVAGAQARVAALLDDEVGG
jgi:hypothetical protein